MVRFFLLMMILTAACYAVVTAYTRSVRRERLERRWDSGAAPGQDRAVFIKEGLADYDRSYRRKLTLLIFVVPFLIVAFRIWTQNFSGHR